MSALRHTQLYNSYSSLVCKLGLNCRTLRPLHQKQRVWHSTVGARMLSLNGRNKIKDLSDVESYLERDFTLSDLRKKFDEMNLPAAVTTATLLKDCESVNDVLGEIKNAALAGKLWKDEITLYFDALRQQIQKAGKYDVSHDLHRECEDFQIASPSLFEFHDSPYFQLLIKEALLHSPRFTTNELTLLLHCFVVLKIPAASNTMLILVSIIENRINELFPRNVLNCLLSIQGMNCEGLHYLNSFQQGLVQHLENQTVDDISFQQVLLGTSISDRLNLLRLISLKMSASAGLKSAIRGSVYETLNKRPRKNLKNLREAESVLRYASRGNSTFLLGLVLKYFNENMHEMKDVHSEMICDAYQNVDPEDQKTLRYSEVENPNKPE